MKSTTVARSYYPALDGLRGIAILGILIQHNFSFLPIPKFGWTGVDLFFVLSGFLITDILLRTKDQKNFLPNFFIRRILRIFPLYYGLLIVFFVVTPLINQFKDQYTYYSTNQNMLWMPLQNWLYITKPKPHNDTVFNHFWSLSVEEQFYLLWPIIIFACKKIQRLIIITYFILFGCIAFRLSTWLYFGNANINFLLQYMTRVDGLCIGSLIAIWRNISVETASKKLIRLGIILLSLHATAFILTKTIFSNVPHFTIFGYSTITIIFGLVLIFVLEKENKLTKFLFENRVLKGLGKISYGLYVYHWPTLVIFKIYFLNYLKDFGISNYKSIAIISISAVLLAITVSVMSYHFFEKKILAFKDVITVDGFMKRLRQRMLLRYKSAPAK